jgi:hypothetical protein
MPSDFAPERWVLPDFLLLPYFTLLFDFLTLPYFFGPEDLLFFDFGSLLFDFLDLAGETLLDLFFFSFLTVGELLFLPTFGVDTSLPLLLPGLFFLFLSPDLAGYGFATFSGLPLS